MWGWEHGLGNFKIKIDLGEGGDLVSANEDGNGSLATSLGTLALSFLLGLVTSAFSAIKQE